MARGTQFLQLVTMLRDELGRSNSVAVGVDDLPSLKQTINRVYESLYDEYDWPHLRQVFPKITLGAGQRYYNLPAQLDYDRIEQAVVWYSGEPHQIIRGIGFEEYEGYDSEKGERSEPALRWDIRWTGAAEQLEIWPVPSSNDQKLQFTGITKFDRLVNDNDLCLLDDNLVVLFCAAELLARQKSQDARGKLEQAQQRLYRLKGRSQAGGRMIRMGLGNNSGQVLLSGKAVVRVK